MITNYWKSLSEFFSGKRDSIILESTRELKTKLIRFIMKRYDEHTADEIQDLLKNTGDSVKDLLLFRNKMLIRFMDDDMDELIGKIVDSKKSEEPAEPAEKEKNSKVVSGGVVKGSSGKNYISTADVEEKEKKIAAIRAVRDSEKRDDFEATKKLLNRGDDIDAQDRSPGLTADPRVSWASRAARYSSSGPKVPAPLKPNKQSHTITSPKQFPVNQQTTIPGNIKIDKITKSDTKSGIISAQRAVDKLTKDEGPAKGDSMAAALGVPTTAQRTTVDDDGKKSIQIWTVDRVTKFMDPDHGNAQNSAKPMDRTELVKYGVVKRVAQASNIGPDFEGTFHGQRYTRSGREQSKMRSAPSKITGNNIRFKAQINPNKTGDSVIWDANQRKWVQPSEFMAKNADKSSNNDFEDDDKTDPDIKF